MYPLELRQRVIKIWLNGRQSPQEIADRFLVSRHFVTEMVKLYRETGSVERRPHGGGHRKLGKQGDAVLHELVESQPDATLEELTEQLLSTLGSSLTPSGVHRATIRLGITYKKSRSMRRSRRGLMCRQSEPHSLGGRTAAIFAATSLSTNLA
jgi:transposase